jgi:hypothetical protein
MSTSRKNVGKVTRRNKILHHGFCTGEFEPRYQGTDYFGFYHTPCFDMPMEGFCDIVAVLIDNYGRIIFNIRCKDCGTHDALKTTPSSNGDEAVKFFYLSPKLRNRVRRHWWDNL